MEIAQQESEHPFSRPSSNWPRRVLWLAAIALPIPLIVTLVFVPLPGENVTAANFRAIRIGMPAAELRDMLGAPRYESVEMGLVNGPAHYTVNFAQTEEELRARGYQEYVRYVWTSPQITITSIVDADEKVACVYSSGGQSRDLRGFLGVTTTVPIPRAIIYDLNSDRHK